MFTADPELVATRPGQTLIGNQNHFGAAFKATMADAGGRLLRPAREGEPEPPGGCSNRCARSSSRSTFSTIKGQLDLEQHDRARR